MIQLHDVAAVVVVCAAVAALTSRDARGVATGLLVAMAVSPLASSPAPSALAISLRVIGALLAAYLLGTAARRRLVSSEGSSGGLLAEGALAAAAFCVGWWASPVAPLPGSLAAQAAGVSLAAIAVVPLTGRDPLRSGTAVVTLIVAFSLLFEAWVGPSSPLQQLVWTGLLVGAIGATSVLISPVVENAAEAPMAIPAAVAIEIPPAAFSTEADEATEPDEEIEAAGAIDEPDRPDPPTATGAAESDKWSGPGQSARRSIGPREGRLRPRDHR
ncbi:MAG TPA: hypothetical protein VF344_06015 [Candidatus Limnocylindrales bacterium]